MDNKDRCQATTPAFRNQLNTLCRFSPDNINDATNKLFGKEHLLSTVNTECDKLDNATINNNQRAGEDEKSKGNHDIN